MKDIQLIDRFYCNTKSKAIKPYVEFNTAGDLISWDITNLDSPVPLLPICELKQAIKDLNRQKTSIRSSYANQLQAIVVPYTQEERETWETQKAEALDYSADPESVTPMLSAMALSRDIPLSDLVDKCIENIDAFEVVAGHILGLQQAELDAVDVEIAIKQGELDILLG